MAEILACKESNLFSRESTNVKSGPTPLLQNKFFLLHFWKLSSKILQFLMIYVSPQMVNFSEFLEMVTWGPPSHLAWNDPIVNVRVLISAYQQGARQWFPGTAGAINF